MNQLFMNYVDKLFNESKKLYTIEGLYSLIETELRKKLKYDINANRVKNKILIKGLPVRTVCDVINEIPYYANLAGIALGKEFMPAEMHCYHCREVSGSDFSLISIEPFSEGLNQVIEGVGSIDFNLGFAFLLPRSDVITLNRPIKECY